MVCYIYVGELYGPKQQTFIMDIRKPKRGVACVRHCSYPAVNWSILYYAKHNYMCGLYGFVPFIKQQFCHPVL